MIIDKKLIQEALNLAQPSIATILSKKDATWGPKWVGGYIKAPGLNKTICFSFTGYNSKHEAEPWKSKWGKKDDFFNIAQGKRDVADREKMSTRSVVASCPWCLKEGEFLYPGGVHRDGITVSASGAKGSTDEGIAEILLSIIIMLAHLKTDVLIQKKQMKI